MNLITESIPRIIRPKRKYAAPLGLGIGLARPPKILGAAFTPISIPGGVVWLRADLGVTIATGVSGWADQSGNGNNASQVTAGRQPTFSSNGGSNGTPCLKLVTASQQWMQITDSASVKPALQTVMVVGEFTTSSNVFQQFFTRSTSSAEDDGWGIGMNGGTNLMGYWADAYTRVAAVPTISLNTWHMWVGTYDGASIKTYQDGNAAVSVTYSGGIPYPSTTNTLIGAYFTSASTVPTEFLGGNICELVMWNTALSAAQVSLLHSYCVSRYATP